jgi:hypothetical protein
MTTIMIKITMPPNLSPLIPLTITWKVEQAVESENK